MATTVHLGVEHTYTHTCIHSYTYITAWACEKMTNNTVANCHRRQTDVYSAATGTIMLSNSAVPLGPVKCHLSSAVAFMRVVNRWYLKGRLREITLCHHIERRISLADGSNEMTQKLRQGRTLLAVGTPAFVAHHFDSALPAALIGHVAAQRHSQHYVC